MRLTNIETYVIKTGEPNLGGLFWFFIKLETDEGIVGWGETAVLYTLLGVEDGFEQNLKDIFEHYLKDKDPLNRETIYHTLYAGLTDQHPDYITVGLISAIDIALWDITGKYYNTPVYNLLGGKFRDRIRTYTYIYERDVKTTIHEAIGAWTTDPERLGELASDLADEGFTGL